MRNIFPQKPGSGMDAAIAPRSPTLHIRAQHLLNCLHSLIICNVAVSFLGVASYTHVSS